MRRMIVIILLAFIGHAHAERGYGIRNLHDSIEKSAGELFSPEQDTVKPVNNFLQQALRVSPLHHTGLGHAMLRNINHRAVIPRKSPKRIKPLRAFASLLTVLTTNCAFMGLLRPPERVPPPPKKAVNPNVLDAVPDRQTIDFSSPESLLDHAYWQEEALNLEPLLVQQEDPAHLVKHRGVARIPDALSKSTASALRDAVLAELAASTAEEDPDLLANLFSRGVFNTHARANASQTRWELRLPMTAAVRAALGELTAGSLGSVIREVAGPDAELWELSAIISAPGSAPQIIHADTKYTPHPCLITTFVALQDITSTMGPTSYLPGTHTDTSAHIKYQKSPLGFLEFLSTVDGRSSVMDAGDATVYDSRILHCGSANRSDRMRVLLVLTFRHQATPKRSDWSPNSIRAELAGRYTLRTLSRRSALV